MPLREAQLVARRAIETQPADRVVRVGARRNVGTVGSKATKAPISVHMYMLLGLIALIGIPWIFNIGPMRMSSYRIVLCLASLPCIITWLRGKAGGIKAVDLCVIAFSGWIAVSMITISGTPGVQSAGISALETLVPYFLARCGIRNAADFRLFSKALFIFVATLLPFAVIEAVTGINVISRTFALLLPTYGTANMVRSGFLRAQGPFSHPILLGLFCGASFSFAYLVLGYGKPMTRKFTLGGIVMLASMCSISSGPLLGIALQCVLIVWKRVADRVGLTSVWTVTLLAYSVAQLVCSLSGRSLIDVTISRLTFDPMSYWFRNLIWEYGWSSVLVHPWLGTALSEWPRPPWMPSSIDNIWLYFAVKHGLPASLLLGLSVVASLMTVGLKRGLDFRHREYRCAYLVTVISCSLVGLTVHFWDGAYVLMFCIVGSGIWIADVRVSVVAHRSSLQGADRFRNSEPIARGGLHENVEDAEPMAREELRRNRTRRPEARPR